MQQHVSWKAVFCILLAGVVVRCPLVSLSPLLPDLERQLGMGGLQAGILSALPVLCMGLFAPLASRLWGALGLRWMVACALLLEAMGVGFRGVGATLPGLYLSTFVAGAGAGMLNAALPAVMVGWGVARRDTWTSVYGGSLNLGAAAISVLSVPLVASLGSLSVGLDLWAIPVVIVLVVWLRWGPAGASPLMVRERRSRMPRPRGGRVRLAIIFVCLQAVVFYGAIAWMAPYYESRGMHPAMAGNLLGLLSAVEIVAMLLPMIGRSYGRRRLPLGIAVVACAAGLLGLLAMPVSLGWLVAILLGLGVGAMFPLGLLLIADCSKSAKETSTLSGTAFFVAYVGAAVSPIALGELRDSLGGYGVGWLLLLACTAGMAVVAILWKNDELRTPRSEREGGHTGWSSVTNYSPSSVNPPGLAP